MAEVAKLVRRHLPNALTSCGFRNVEHFKTAIYFHGGGLDLYPTHMKA